jgi:regulator of cell morphogenesis and NO signaling
MEDLKKVYLNKLSPEEICPTILEKFRSMKEGDQILLEIDHDPLFLPQFLKSRLGDRFSLFIQQAASNIWNVSLLKKSEEKDDSTIAEIVKSSWKYAEVFEKYNIDYYCNGDRYLESACLEKGLNCVAIKNELNEIDSSDIYNNFNSWGVRYLIDFLIDSRIKLSSEFIPRINELSQKITLTDGVNHPETILVYQKIETFMEDLERFIAHEKAFVPTLKRYASDNEEKSQSDRSLMKQLKAAIDKMTKESKIISKELIAIKNITNNFHSETSASFTLKNLYAVMALFEKHLHKHLHIENNILFPKILTADKKMEVASFAG